MTSHTSTIEELKANALAAIARCSSMHFLAAHVDAGREEDEAIQAEIRELEIVATEPLELVAAMRAPVGTQSVLDLDVPGGRDLIVVVNGLGETQLVAEHEAWLQLYDLARTEAA